MGLLNARNLRKAKHLLEKNRHKIGGAVEKAGEQLDKASKGKTSNVTSKASDAAKKYSAGGVTHHGLDTPAEDPGQQVARMSPEEAQLRQAQATTSAANAVAGAANALTGLMNKAAAKAEQKNTDPVKAPSADDMATDEFDRG